VQELLASGNKIEAIKQYRTETGMGLAEAKAAVDSYAG
jgi:ribosomal protein L7/L12